MPSANQFGHSAEALAAQCLRQKGYRILEQNLRVLNGELDIVAQDGETLVFIEVKGRRTQSLGNIAFAIDDRKKRQIIKLASYYLSEKGFTNQPCRFDAIFVNLSNANTPELTHVSHAFEVSSSDWQW